MNIAIVGSRAFTDYETLKSTVLKYIAEHQIEVKAIISGGAKGADKLAEKFADEHQFEMIVFNPDWETHGRQACPMRNTQIVEKADVVFAFWNGTSTGTQDSIQKAELLNKTVLVTLF